MYSILLIFVLGDKLIIFYTIFDSIITNNYCTIILTINIAIIFIIIFITNAFYSSHLSFEF